jgi:hypothetical protein
LVPERRANSTMLDVYFINLIIKKPVVAAKAEEPKKLEEKKNKLHLI